MVAIRSGCWLQASGFALFIAMALSVSLESHAQTLIHENPPTHGSAFGSAVAATSKGIIFVGAPFSDDSALAGGALTSGAVEVFDASGQHLGTISLGNSAAQWDAFGLSLATHGKNSISGANILIGAPGTGGDKGIVYLYNGASIVVLDTFDRIGGGGVTGDRFGTAVTDVDGSVVVGAPGVKSQNILNVGAVNVFNMGAAPDVEINNPDPPNIAGGDRFGHAVAAVDSTTFAVGAPRDNHAGANAGSVWQFDLSGNQVGNRINGGAGDRFGSALAQAGKQMLLVGAPGYTPSLVPAGSPPLDESGRAYLIDMGSSQVIATFENPFPSRLARFGSSVAAVGDFALIGAPGSYLSGISFAGAAYLFKMSTGQLLAKYEEPQPNQTNVNNGNSFGDAVALFGTQYLISVNPRAVSIVGAPTVDHQQWNSGAAFINEYCRYRFVQTGCQTRLEDLMDRFTVERKFEIRLEPKLE